MKQVKFLKVTTVDFEDHRGESCIFDHERTFYNNQIIFTNDIEETVKGFYDIRFANGDIAIGINKNNVEINEV